MKLNGKENAPGNDYADQEKSLMLATYEFLIVMLMFMCPKMNEGNLTKAKKSMFLGYSEETKGYRLYDSERNKVIFSRDVYFHEHRKDNLLEPLEKQHSKTEKIILQNDMTSEDSEDNDEESEITMPPEIQESAV